MTSGTFNGVMTGLLIVVFLGIVAWAYSKRNKEAFDEMAHMPLQDDVQEKKESSHD